MKKDTEQQVYDVMNMISGISKIRLHHLYPRSHAYVSG